MNVIIYRVSCIGHMSRPIFLIAVKSVLVLLERTDAYGSVAAAAAIWRRRPPIGSTFAAGVGVAARAFGSRRAQQKGDRRGIDEEECVKGSNKGTRNRAEGEGVAESRNNMI